MPLARWRFGPRPAKRGCRSGHRGRGWERPPCSACLDRHREGWSRTAPSPRRYGVAPSQQSLAGRPQRPVTGPVSAFRRDAGQAHRPAGRPPGPPPPRCGALHLPGRNAGTLATPGGRGRRVRKHTRPRTRTEPLARGVASVTACAARAARAGRTIPAQDVAAPAVARGFRCAVGKRRRAHRTPMSFARSGTVPSRGSVPPRPMRPVIGRGPSRVARSARRRLGRSNRAPSGPRPAMSAANASAAAYSFLGRSPIDLAHEIRILQRRHAEHCRPQVRAAQKSASWCVELLLQGQHDCGSDRTKPLNGGERLAGMSTLGKPSKCLSCTMLSGVSDVSGRPLPMRWRSTPARERKRGRRYLGWPVRDLERRAGKSRPERTMEYTGAEPRRARRRPTFTGPVSRAR